MYCCVYVYKFRHVFMLVLPRRQSLLCHWSLNLYPLSHAINLTHSLLTKQAVSSSTLYQIQGLYGVHMKWIQFAWHHLILSAKKPWKKLEHLKSSGCLNILTTGGQRFSTLYFQKALNTAAINNSLKNNYSPIWNLPFSK